MGERKKGNGRKVEREWEEEEREKRKRNNGKEEGVKGRGRMVNIG